MRQASTQKPDGAQSLAVETASQGPWYCLWKKVWGVLKHISAPLTSCSRQPVPQQADCTSVSRHRPHSPLPTAGVGAPVPAGWGAFPHADTFCGWELGHA